VALSEQVRRFLEEERYAVLATINPDGSIQQTVMWYQLQDDQIMMNTARGRTKDRNLLRDRRVSICIEDEYRYVTISGEVDLIDDQERAQADIMALAIRYHGRERGEAQARDYFTKQVRITLLLPITTVIADGFEG
jgi:PPOX class probable F420-dependent enzyme